MNEHEQEKHQFTIITKEIPVEVAVYEVTIEDNDDGSASLLFSFDILSEVTDLSRDDIGTAIGEMLLASLERYVRENVDGYEDFTAEINGPNKEVPEETAK